MIPARAAVAGIRGTIGGTAGDLVIIGAGVVHGILSCLLRPEDIEIITQSSPATVPRVITTQWKTRLIVSRFPSRALAGRSLAGVGGAVPRGPDNRAALPLLLGPHGQPQRPHALPPIGSKMGDVCPLRVPRGNCGLIVAGNAKRYTARKPPQDCHRGPWRNLEACHGGSGRSLGARY
jgi:hypothetical protein